MILLALLEERSRHGYELAKLIESQSDSKLQFQVASLYPMLYRLERKKLVEGRWVEKAGERRRRFYKITPAGREALARSPPSLARIRGRAERAHGVQPCLTGAAGTPAPAALARATGARKRNRGRTGPATGAGYPATRKQAARPRRMRCAAQAQLGDWDKLGRGSMSPRTAAARGSLAGGLHDLRYAAALLPRGIRDSQRLRC